MNPPYQQDVDMMDTPLQSPTSGGNSTSEIFHHPNEPPSPFLSGVTKSINFGNSSSSNTVFSNKSSSSNKNSNKRSRNELNINHENECNCESCNDEPCSKKKNENNPAKKYENIMFSKWYQSVIDDTVKQPTIEDFIIDENNIVFFINTTQSVTLPVLECSQFFCISCGCWHKGECVEYVDFNDILKDIEAVKIHPEVMKRLLSDSKKGRKPIYNVV